MTTTASIGGSEKLRIDYLNLLVTQLRHQNPLEPMNNSEMASQLSQFAQLEQLEDLNGSLQSSQLAQGEQLKNLNSSFAKVLAATQIIQAATLVGRQITYTSEDEDGTTVTLTGAVDRVEFIDGQVHLVVGEQAVGFERVLSIGD